jgi:hypothetical protein
VDDAVILDHAAMTEATFHHFQGLLGTSLDREFTLDLDFLGLGAKACRMGCGNKVSHMGRRHDWLSSWPNSYRVVGAL